MPSNKSRKGDDAPPGKITDSRFANFETDPRYRLPSKRKTKTTIDKRFSRVLKDDDFTATAQVDRYGRKLNSGNKKKAMQRLYQEEDEGDEGEDHAESGEDDDIVRRELAKADKAYDPARGGGFSSSDESDSDDEEEDEDEDGGAQVDDGSGMQRFQNEQAEVPSGEVTNRIAIVNLDWDHIKAPDLMALFSSFASAGGRIEKVSIYPSEFGKERMQREELEGPPKEIFKRAKSADEESDDSEDDTQDEEDDESEQGDEDVKNELIEEGDDQDFDSDALRSYQLDRLRYFYAVMVCSNNATAEKIYGATDGTEYLSSSNFIDLRFIPDDVTFDDEPREECTSVPSGHKPVDFVTDALQHSKVKLTWDMHPEDASRKESMKQAFSGSRADIADNDLRAYLASDSESDGEEAIGEPEKEVSAEPKLSKKELARKKMREALGLSNEPAAKASKDGSVGDMQITFKPALSDKPSKKGQDAEQEETTVEKYMRKERERKEEARKRAKAKREGLDPDASADEEQEEPKEDLGFDDPFFTAEEPGQASKSALRKEERLQKRAAREAEEKEKAAAKAQLELLMADTANEDAPQLDSFDMNEIVKAEKKKGSKKKGKKGRGEERGGLQEGFQLDVGDSRFKAIFDSHEFAIDPSNPKYKETPGMKKLLEEGRKKRTRGDGDGDVQDSSMHQGREKKKARVAGGDLTDLVARVKGKAAKR